MIRPELQLKALLGLPLGRGHHTGVVHKNVERLTAGNIRSACRTN